MKAFKIHRAVFVFILVVAGFMPNRRAEPGQHERGTLDLTVVDELTQQATPARIELLDESGSPYFAEDALPVGALGTVAKESTAPWQGTLKEWRAVFYRKIPNPFTNTKQFYGVGHSRFSLPAGEYHLKIYKGIEYRVQTREIEIEHDKTTSLTVPLTRWINMPQRGWYGADDHLHIARPHKELEPSLSKWMQAEDIHVANLLQ